MEDVPAATPIDPVHVHASADEDRNFVFHPEGDDLFVRTGKQLIDDCRLGISLQVWFQEVHDMAEHVAAWSRQRSVHVSKVYVSARGTRIVLLVIPIGDQFDFDLADALVDLEEDLRTRVNVGTVELLQVPEAELHRFVDPRHARPVYDGSEPAHQPVAS